MRIVIAQFETNYCDNDLIAVISTYDIFRQLVTGKVLDVLVSCIDDFGELLALNHLLKDVHSDTVCNEVHKRQG